MGRTRDGRPMFYDREGRPLTTLEWAKVFERRFGPGGDDYHLIARIEIGDVLISTVWEGLDHNLSGGEPAYFETMIFDGGYLFDRYGSEEAARDGHERAIIFVESGQYAIEMSHWDGPEEQ